MPITIPKRLQKKLHSDSTYEGYIHTLLNNTAALITEKADFFPEYTLHGWSHIQAVLNHADKLIPDVTLKALSGWDAAILITAVVIHDLGMFLNKAGVSKLLTGPRRTTKTDLLDKYNWKDEWDRYIREIRRYSEEKLLYHFGMSHAIEEPDLEKDKFSDLDLLIVGDFLRRHHPRIAHEIALGTMPGDTDVDVLQVGLDALGCKAFSEKDRKCIGILARSHGMPIRGTLRYIEQELGKLYQEKLSYLMTILRIADALDADQQRAPDTRRKLDGIRTPVSVKEWIWNQRITRTDLDWGKAPDSKYVEAKPHSTTEYVHLENWLNWVQQELDTSWAVLSEVCDTRKFRLSIHRVESNILEEGQREFYSKKFITKEARLNANPELLKLLVGPLYDDDPSCGVRELLQNAVDACNERAHLEGNGYRGQVEIRLDTKAKTLTVTDNGIGMDENVLLNYYLSAGASYRTSEVWFERFATDREPNIVRTGRFGVGVLATFLLGDRVEVITRHMHTALGYTFQFGVEPEPLDIRRLEESSIGTTIKVKLKNDVLEQLLEDYKKEKTWLNWYRFAEPSVQYWVDDDEYVSFAHPIPSREGEIPGWLTMHGTKYDMVHWGYRAEGFYCNGFRIPNGEKKVEKKRIGYDPFYENTPCVSVVDKKGCLRLDLSRRTLQDFPEREKLYLEISRYMTALILAADWSSEKAVVARLGEGVLDCNTGIKLTKRIEYICSPNCYSVPEVVNLFADGDFSVLRLYGRGIIPINLIRCMEPKCPIIVYPIDKTKFYLASESYLVEKFTNAMFDPLLNLYELTQCWSSEEVYRSVSENYTFDYYNTDLWPRKIGEDCVEYIKNKHRKANIPPFLLDQWNRYHCPIISKMRFNKANYTGGLGKIFGSGYLFDFIQTYMDGDPWIPYDMEERKKKFPKAFEELKYYIERILADREKERGVT